MDTRSNTHPILQKFTLLKSGVRFLCVRFYQNFIEPKSLDEDVRRKEFILNCILSGSILLLAALDSIIAWNSIIQRDAYRGIPFLYFSLIVLFFIAFLALSRRKKVRLASYLLIACYFAGASYGMYRWGVGMQTALLAYVLIIVISSVLISTRFGFWTTVILSTCSIVMAHLQFDGIFDPDWYWQINPQHQLGEEISIMFLLIMTVSWLSNREIEKSLRRARLSEQALKDERDSLEVKVEERTRDLKEVQIEKMTELYRFAEFGRLSSGIFHDLVNPLTSVAMNVGELKESADPHIGETKRYVEKAVTAAKRMEHFIAAVQKQIQTHESECLFSLNEEIEQAIELLEYRARKTHVTISFTAEKELHTHGNPIKFHQIAINLISNAIDSYRNEQDKPRTIEVVLTPKSPHQKAAVFSVKDYGCGIDPGILSKVFDPFFTTKSEQHGTGLGLSTTKSAVERNFSGTVDVVSKLGQGSLFTVSIPLREKELANKKIS